MPATAIHGFALRWTASYYCIGTDVASSKGVQAPVVLKEVCKEADLGFIRTVRHQGEHTVGVARIRTLAMLY